MPIKVSNLTELPSPILATDTIYVVRSGVSYKATGANIPFAGQPKVYKALLTQTGTAAPVATVLENTLSGTPVWSYSAVGVYIATLASEFVNLKTGIISTATFEGFTTTYVNSVNEIGVISFSNLGVKSNDLLFKQLIEIRVYP